MKTLCCEGREFGCERENSLFPRRHAPLQIECHLPVPIIAGACRRKITIIDPSQWVSYAPPPRAILMELESRKERWQFSCLIMEARRSVGRPNLFRVLCASIITRAEPLRVCHQKWQSRSLFFILVRATACTTAGARAGERERLISAKRAQEFLLVLQPCSTVFALMEIAEISKRSCFLRLSS